MQVGAGEHLWTLVTVVYKNSKYYKQYENYLNDGHAACGPDLVRRGRINNHCFILVDYAADYFRKKGIGAEYLTFYNKFLAKKKQQMMKGGSKILRSKTRKTRHKSRRNASFKF